MSKSVAAYHPAVVRPPSRSSRSLIAVLLVALASLGATIGYIAIDDSGTTTARTAVANGQSSPTLEDPFQARTQATRSLGGPDESAVASAISPQPSVTGPDESAIAAAVGNQSETGSQARFQAYQDKLGAMTTQQKADAFAR